MSDRFEPARFKRKTAAVLGMGRSGLQVANLLVKKGFKVLVSDSKPRREVRLLAAKLHPRAKWEAGGHSDRLLKCAFAVKSPGMPPSAPVLAKLRKAAVPVFSELEVSLAFCKAKQVVAVTGTNGKTTTTMLTAAVFKAAGRRVHVCGNIGLPLARLAAKVGASDAVVLEASSYQLEDSRWFHPTAAALLNVAADHLDHHGGMARYVEAKAKVFRFQHRGDLCVFNHDDAIAVRLSRECGARRLFFSHRPSTQTHAWIDGGKLRLRLPGQKKETALVPPKLPGAHNLENAMAAALLGLGCGVKPAAIQKAFKTFKGIEHRIEDCGTVAGIRCVNDSKATNVDSTLIALRSFSHLPGKVLLILGGLHKGFPYTPLKAFLGSTVKGILAIGAAARKIEEDLGGTVPIFPCETLGEAVRAGLKIGQEGDLLLLSPACASFDQFRDFEDRGRQFKALVGDRASALASEGMLEARDRNRKAGKGA